MVVGQVEVEAGGPSGHSYRGAVLTAPRDAVLARAAAARFSGWVGPQEGDHVLLVPSSPHLVVASGGRDLEALTGDLLGELLGEPGDPAGEATGGPPGGVGPALVVEVVRDRLLSLVLLTGGEEPLRYLSDPSLLDPDDLDEPRGAHHAPVLARTFGVPGVAVTLREALSELLDPEHYIESERVARVLGLLGLPIWLVSAWSLPRRVSYGPEPRAFTRLGAGVAGVGGWPAGWAVGPVRRVRQKLTRRPDGPRPDGLAVEGIDGTGLW